VKVTLCERAPRLPTSPSVITFIHLWFRFQTCRNVFSWSCMPVIWHLKG